MSAGVLAKRAPATHQAFKGKRTGDPDDGERELNCETVDRSALQAGWPPGLEPPAYAGSSLPTRISTDNCERSEAIQRPAARRVPTLGLGYHGIQAGHLALYSRSC